MKSKGFSLAAVVSLFLLGTSGFAEAASITWNFTGGGGEGTIGNSLIFTAGGITAKATAWSYDTSFQQARLGQWSTGLGVCGVPETCSSPVHQVDNVGEHEYVLFLFSAPVDPTTVRIDPYGTYDRDVSYWSGNVVSPISLTGVLYGDLGSLGFSPRIDNGGTSSSSYRDVSITNIPPFVNALLFGAKLNGTGDGDDRFKITNMSASVAVPEPSSLFLLGTGILGLVWLRRKQQASV